MIRKSRKWSSWIVVGLGLFLVALIVCAGLPYLDLYYLRPVYPVSAHNRGLQFREVILALRMYSAYGQEIPTANDSMKFSWRAVVAQQECGVPRELVEVDWSLPWERAVGSTLDKCGKLNVGRDDDSPFVFAINGPGTAYSHGFRDLSMGQKPYLVLIESDHRGIHWMQPRDFEIDDLRASRGLRPGSEYGRGFHVAFSDGSVWYLRRETPLDVLATLSVIDQNGELDREDVLSGFVILKRFHK